MNTTTQKKTWTEAELMSLPKEEGRHELVDGELVITPLYGFWHSQIIMRLVTVFYRVDQERDLGCLVGFRLGCWMRSGNCRCPDLSYVSRERTKNQPRDGFLRGAPDLVVELVRPSVSVEAIRAKVLDYFESGCRLMWIVDPDNRTVTVLGPDGSETTVTDTLTGEDVIPGFEIAVSELFRVLR